jgi:hypothetical protein
VCAGRGLDNGISRLPAYQFTVSSSRGVAPPNGGEGGAELRLCSVYPALPALHFGACVAPPSSLLVSRQP